MKVDYYFINGDQLTRDGLTIPLEYIFESLYASIRMKSAVIVSNNLERSFDLKSLSAKHSHLEEDFIFLNISLKNKIKSLEYSSKINSLVNLKAYLEETL